MTAKIPRESVLVMRRLPREGLLTSTIASDTTEPEISRTAPVIDPVPARGCATAADDSIQQAATIASPFRITELFSHDRSVAIAAHRPGVVPQHGTCRELPNAPGE